MNNTLELSRRWVLLGAACGILANIIYIFSAASIEGGSLPLKIIYPIAWLFGPLVIVAGNGIYHFLAVHGISVRLQLARLFMIIAGTVITLAIAVRGVGAIEFSDFKPAATDPIATSAWNYANNSIMFVQHGMELSFGLFIFLAAILFGTVFLTFRLSGKIIGTIGIIVAGLGLVFDFAGWPTGAESAGLVNSGPFVGMWFIAVSIMMWLHYRSLGRSAEI